MEIETKICPKCHRQGCFIADIEPAHEQNFAIYPNEIWHDFTCKCGHTISEQEYINPTTGMKQKIRFCPASLPAPPSQEK